MRKTLSVAGVSLALLTAGAHGTAAAQTSTPPAPPADSTPPARPLVTVRLHAGPNLNLMHDWRSGIDALQGMTEMRGLSPQDKPCLCLSWGTTALAHVTPHVAIGGALEMLRDTRAFTVTDTIRSFGPPRNGSFGFGHEAIVQTKQLLLALYPRQGSHTHVQFGGGTGSGRTDLSTPGSNAAGRARGTTWSVSVGTESRFMYVDAGWRRLRMRTMDVAVHDSAIDEARDVFASAGELEAFVRGRETDLTGGWLRAGLVLHLGRR